MQAFWIGLLITLLSITTAAGASVERVEGALLLEASLPRRAFAAGEPVEVTLTARNTGTSPLGITFTSGQRVDFIVRRPRGDEVWRWSHDKAFIQAVQTAPLQPKEVLTFRETWDQRDLQGRRVDPGPYEVIAVFLGQTGGGPSGRASIQLPPLAFSITK